MKSEVLAEKFKMMRSNGQPIIIAGVGSGLTARAAALGGADLLAVYSTAIYRMKGLPTALSFLPYDNANDMTFSTAPEVLANAGDTPVLFGIGAHDPRTTPSQLINQAMSLGAAGILNEPFAGMYGHQLVSELDKLGLGFSQEVELIECAGSHGLITLGWVFNQEEAIKMVQVGAQIIGVIIAITQNIGQEQSEQLQDAIMKIRSIVTSVKAVREEVLVLGHGGPLTSPSIVAEVMKQTHMDGYFTGSTGERFPVEQGIANTIRQYKNMNS